MKKTYAALKISSAMCAGLCLVTTGVKANQYFDVNGATSGFGTATGGSYSWDANNWSTSSTGVAATTAYPTPGSFPRFLGTGNYTVTVNADESMAGMFLDNTVTMTVNAAGIGDLNITSSGAQGFLTDGSTSSLIINAPIVGIGGVENENGGSLFLYGINTYGGGTIFGTSGGLNINSSSSLGTGGVSWGVSQQVFADPTATSPIVLPTGNALTTRATSQMITVTPSAGGIVFSGTTTLASGGTSLFTQNANSSLTLGGVVGGSGNLAVSGPGTLFLGSANNFTGGLQVSNGTVVLNAANGYQNATLITLQGGTLNVNGHSQSSTAPISLVAITTLDLGAGHQGVTTLTFANSSPQSWTGTLNISDFNPNIDTIQVGTDATGLTGTQLSDIVIDGGTLGATGINSFGDLYLIPEPSSLALGALGGIGMLWMVKRRKQA